jgi:DnaK suppressor protein
MQNTEAIVNTDRYKLRLQAQEQELSTRMKQMGARARQPSVESVGDAGDASVDNERKEEQLRDADADWTVLTQVREALERIDNGTFGTCVVDGRAIEEKRLEAIPWTPYCLNHQQESEGAGPSRTATL